MWFPIIGIWIVALPLIGLALYSIWHDKRVDKYNEWLKEQESLKDSPESV